jgi:hypothetical protein
LSKELRDPGDLTGPVTFLLLLLIAVVVIRGLEPPPLSDQKAPVSEFSEAGAMRDVRAIARLPHPLASAEHERVREYIVGRLRELGANPEVQTLTVARLAPSGPETWAVVRNVVARIPGSASIRIGASSCAEIHQRSSDGRELRLGAERAWRGRRCGLGRGDSRYD